MTDSNINETPLWIGFIIFVLVMLFLDLKVFHRKSEKVSVKNALVWSAVWIAMSLAFGVGIYLLWGHEIGLQYFTGYLIEKSLSVDNLFVFLMVFSYFCVKDEYQHRVLFWGILGAIVMRAAFIFAGIGLLNALSWVIYIFGAFLVYTGVRMAVKKEEKVEAEHNLVLRLVRRLFPVSKDYHGEKFFIVEGGVRKATPLLLVLVLIESTDIVFALDSVPAILSITKDPFIVFSSNIFAILGLRSLYFALAGVLQKLRYLHYGLAAVLVFLGVKMLIGHWVEIPILLSLGVIAVILVVAITTSLVWSRRNPQSSVEAERGIPK
ncbi:MAG: TerC family protein [Dehalococcoidia bacterium]|nr:MAG: TerC family protein [Dehalococcoidia bacterium]